MCFQLSHVGLLEDFVDIKCRTDLLNPFLKLKYLIISNQITVLIKVIKEVTRLYF